MKKVNQQFYSSQNKLGFNTPETLAPIRKLILKYLSSKIDAMFHHYETISLIQIGFGNGQLIKHLRQHYSNNKNLKVIGVDYTASKIDQQSLSHPPIEYKFLDVEDNNALNDFVDNYIKDHKKNHATIILMVELIDDLSTEFFSFKNGNAYQLYGTVKENIKPLFMYNTWEQLCWLFGRRETLNNESRSKNHWNQVSLQMKKLSDSPLKKHLFNPGQWTPIHSHTASIFKSLGKIKDQKMVIIDYLNLPNTKCSPIRIYPQLERKRNINPLTLMCIASPFIISFLNPSETVLNTISFLFFIATLNALNIFENSYIHGQTTDSNTPFDINKHIYYLENQQQMTSNVNMNQIKTELTTQGYTETNSNLNKDLNHQCQPLGVNFTLFEANYHLKT
ncbi:MAG: hypothetical protein VW397_01400 [Candidatus Margulisiibacteriota bacterium]